MNLRTIQVQCTVKRKPTSRVIQPRNVMCSLPMGRMWSVKAFQPPSFSIHKPTSSLITEWVDCTIDWTTSGWPVRTQSAAKDEEIVRKLMILPQVTSLCLKRERPIVSTITGAASGTKSEVLMNVRGWSRSNSKDIRFKMTTMWRRDEFGRTSNKIGSLRVKSPSRLSFSLINCEQRHWIWM